MPLTERISAGTVAASVAQDPIFSHYDNFDRHGSAGHVYDSNSLIDNNWRGNYGITDQVTLP